MLFERSERVCTEVNPAHGGYSNARDLARLYSALLAQLDGAGNPALPPRRHSPHSRAPSAHPCSTSSSTANAPTGSAS